MYRAWHTQLDRAGATIKNFEPDFWSDSREIFAGIQAHEAALLHHGHFDQFEKPIGERLAWGASLSSVVVEGLRERHAAFRAQMDTLLAEHDFLMLPCAPMSTLPAGADHSATRQKILRYTTPASLAGMPAVTLPASGGGVQLIGPRGGDARLLAFAANLMLGSNA